MPSSDNGVPIAPTLPISDAEFAAGHNCAFWQ
jgi:hypothetical protein